VIEKTNEGRGKTEEGSVGAPLFPLPSSLFPLAHDSEVPHAIADRFPIGNTASDCGNARRGQGRDVTLLIRVQRRRPYVPSRRRRNQYRRRGRSRARAARATVVPDAAADTAASRRASQPSSSLGGGSVV
jgi:hypothetical protein